MLSSSSIPEPSRIVRAFLALRVPPEVIGKLKVLQSDLSALFDEVAWTRADSLHLTIRFFGNVSREHLEELERTIREICANVPPFPMRAEKVGCFSERVIWAGIGGAMHRLQDLETRIGQATRGFGDHKEEREFRPHLTIGRVKRGRAGKMSVAERLVGWAGAEFGGWTVDHLELMRSELSRQGARHTRLAEIALAGRFLSEG